MSKLLSYITQQDLNEFNGPLNQYVDLSIVNGGSGNEIGLTFTEARSSKIIEDPGAYFLSIARLHIDSISLPSMIIQKQTGQNNPNLTIYSFTMTYKTFTYQQYIIYEPTDLTKSPSDISYYYVYNFNTFVRMVNNALYSCFQGLKTASNNTLSTNNAPFFLYDPSSSSLTLIADVEAYEDSLEYPINIYMNSSCHTLFSAFEYKNYGNNMLNGMNYRFVIKNLYGSNILSLNDNYNAVTMFEEYNCTSLWCPISSLVITCNLNITETVQFPTKSYNVDTSLVNSNPNQSLPVLTDIELDVTTGKEFKSSVLYAPINYRLIDLYGHTEIYSISISCYFKDIYGNLTLMTLPPGCSADIKLIFIHKSLRINQ